jgi:hypothetical protein
MYGLKKSMLIGKSFEEVVEVLASKGVDEGKCGEWSAPGEGLCGLISIGFEYEDNYDIEFDALEDSGLCSAAWFMAWED